MKVFISGALGFVGHQLSEHLLDQGHHVIGLGTQTKQNRIEHTNFSYLSTTTLTDEGLANSLASVDAVVNLAGKTILKRWTQSYKQQIYDSRILTTRRIVEALPIGKDISMCSASAVGYYGSCGDTIVTEQSPPGNDFLARVGQDWENEAWRAENRGVRVVAARFGIVLGHTGGAMQKMITAFKSYVGGPLGDGSQWFPWIHIADLLTAIQFVIENREMTGPVNFCAPNPVRNLDLAKAMGQALKKPSSFPTPAFMLRLAMGEFGNTLLASQRVTPEKLMAHGFQFKFDTIESAVADILNSE